MLIVKSVSLHCTINDNLGIKNFPSQFLLSKYFCLNYPILKSFKSLDDITADIFLIIWFLTKYSLYFMMVKLHKACIIPTLMTISLRASAGKTCNNQVVHEGILRIHYLIGFQGLGWKETYTLT